MRSAAHEVEILKTLHTIMGPEVEHLVNGMRQVEGGSHENVPLIAPVDRRENSFRHDVLAEILHARPLLDSLDHLISIFPLRRLPIMPVTGVDRRDENIEL